MKTLHRFGLACLASSWLTALLATSCHGGTTVVNRTANDLYVAVAIERAAGPTHALDSSHPGHMETTGWFKLNRYGGSATVPYALSPNPYTFGQNAASVASYILVEADGGRKIRQLPKGSLTFPVGRPNGFTFKWTFPDEPNGPRSNGRLAAEAGRRGLSLETFAPMAAYQSRGKVELTIENLGWSGAQEPPNQLKGQLELDGGEITVRRYKGQADADSRRIEQIVNRFIQDFLPIAHQVPEGVQVLGDARALAKVAQRVPTAHTELQARDFIHQVSRAWDALYRRLDRASGGRWGARSTPLLQIRDILPGMGHQF